MMFTGGCACGAIRFECQGEPLFMARCHCRDCQRSSGGGFASVLVVPRQTVTLTQGQPRRYSTRGESGGVAHREFCADCGSPLFSHGEALPEMIAIKPASLDDPSWFHPRAEVWTRSAQPWVTLDPDIPHFERVPEA